MAIHTTSLRFDGQIYCSKRNNLLRCPALE